MTCIAFVGRPRTGKTLFMTFHGFHDFLNGAECYSNYYCKFADRMEVDDMLDIPFTDLERHPKTLMIQEADKIFDSWLRGTEQRLLSSLTGQSGKRNLNIYFDTQFPNRVQNSLRQIVEMEIVANVVNDQYGQPALFEYQFTDIYDGRQWIKRIPAPLMQPFYNLYDSYETTRPTLANKERLIQKGGND